MPKLTIISTIKPDTLTERVKDKLRATKIKGIPSCPNCFMLDYEINYIAGTKTKVCVHCKMKHNRIVIMRE